MADSTHHVVNLSGGITSWMAGRLVVDEIAEPTDTVTLLFADTLIESWDVYGFLVAGAADLGYPVTRIADGRTPWQVFRDERLLGSNLKAPCSRALKRNLIDRWRRCNCDPETSRHYVGLDWTEINRFERHRDILAEKGWTACAPLIDARLSKQDALAEAKRRRLPVPAAYYEQFNHANCAGMCVRAGIAHWTRLYALHPERFAEAERQEAELRRDLGEHAILRDRSGGTTRPLPLSELRKRIEASAVPLLPLPGGGCGCALEED